MKLFRPHNQIVEISQRIFLQLKLRPRNGLDHDLSHYHEKIEQLLIFFYLNPPQQDPWLILKYLTFLNKIFY